MKKKIVYLSILIFIITISTLGIINNKTKEKEIESKIGELNHYAIEFSYNNLESLSYLLDKEFTLDNYDAMLMLLENSDAWLRVGFLQKGSRQSIRNNIATDNLNPKMPAEYFDSVKDVIEKKVRHLSKLSEKTEIDALKENIKDTCNLYKKMTVIIDEELSDYSSYDEMTLKAYQIFNTNASSELVDKLQEIYSEVLFNVE